MSSNNIFMIMHAYYVIYVHMFIIIETLVVAVGLGSQKHTYIHTHIYIFNTKDIKYIYNKPTS